MAYKLLPGVILFLGFSLSACNGAPEYRDTFRVIGSVPFEGSLEISK